MLTFQLDQKFSYISLAHHLISLVGFTMVKHGVTAESNYQWWTHSVQSGTLEHSGEQLAVEKMEKAQLGSSHSHWESGLNPWIYGGFLK